MEMQRASNSMGNLGKKVGRPTLPYIKAYFKIIVIKTMTAKPG